MEQILKIDPEYFEDAKNGTKSYSVRDRSDRNFSVGDILTKREYDREKEEYSGRYVQQRVTHILTDQQIPWALKEGTCIMGVQVIGYGDQYREPVTQKAGEGLPASHFPLQVVERGKK